jgi:DNA-binding transcriptional LysR family regulator
MHWDSRVGRRLKLHDLHVFLAVVQAGSMSKAATRLAVSQPAVSKAIADMEHVLGVRLLDRTAQGVEPTRYGRALIGRGTAVFDELSQGVKEIEFLADPTVGELRIGSSEPVAAGIVSLVIGRVARRYPKIVYHVQPGHTATLYQDLLERKVELVVTRIFDVAPDKEIHVEPVCDDTIVIVAGTRSRWARARQVALTDLVQEPWTLPPLDSLHGMRLVQAFRAAGVDLPGDMPRATVFTFSDQLRNTLVATAGYLTAYPGIVMRPPVRHPCLRALPIALPATRRPIAIVTLTNRTLSPIAQVFIETARAVARELATDHKES